MTNPRPQAPRAKPSYTDLESALVAEREAREKATYRATHWRDEAAQWKDQLNEALARAEKAEEALRETRRYLSEKRITDTDLGNALGVLDAALFALPASHDGNQGLEDCPAPQPEEETDG